MRSARSVVRNAFAFAALVMALSVFSHPLSGQTETQRLVQQATGQELTQDQILERLKASGVSREEARTRLRQAGYDPSLVDPYYDQLAGFGGAFPAANASSLNALVDVGLLRMGVGPADALGMASGEWERPAATPPDTIRPGDATNTLEVFGLDLFRGATDQFQPLTMGPVGPDYRLGPGDQLILLLTGDVELAYTLEVTRESFIVIPDVGQVSVNGLTLERLRDRLFDRLGRVYSGVRRGADATTFFDLSLGRLRTNQVFVIGDVARPGAYQISAVATVLNALYRGGGPTEVGSFRSVTVNRGGRVVARVDLYDYLLRGDASGDVRLEHGDVVFVPPVEFQVAVNGRVRRPGIYEISPGESVVEALQFAGGAQPEAHIQRVQVDRILPPAQREPGRDRVLLDADLLALETGSGQPFPLEPGDEVTVYGVLEREEGRVTLEGDVWRPGEYEFTPGMTIWDLITQADGLPPSAFTPVAHIHRIIPETGGTRLLRASLEIDAQGQPWEDPPLEELDHVVVFSVDNLRTADSVQIFGLVKGPGSYLLDEGATVEDLILKAGGYTIGAQAFEAEVIRIEPGVAWSERVGTRYDVRIDGNIPHPMGDRINGAAPDPEVKMPLASEFPLQAGDQLFIRRLPGYTPPAHASVSGEVLYPGSYGFELRRERLSTLVTRAGGFTADAYLPGARLVRDSIPVGIELEAALAQPGGSEDVLVEPGDELIIPRFDPTVLVTGAVAFQSRVLYRDGGRLEDFLSGAGGAAEEADLDRISVQYPSGERAVTGKFLFFRRHPDVKPGSTIFVPSKGEDSGTDWDQLLTRALSMTTTVLTIMVLSNQLK